MSRSAGDSSTQLALDLAPVEEPAAAAGLDDLGRHRRERRVEDAARLAQSLYEQGCDLVERDPSAAVEAFERVLAQAPDHLDAHLDLGRCHHEAGRLAAAERHYREALRIAPDDPTAWFNLGVALQDRGVPEEALAAYLRAAELDPGAADPRLNAARLCEEMGERQRALRLWKELRALASGTRPR